MSIFSKIKDAIFGRKGEAGPSAPSNRAPNEQPKPTGYNTTERTQPPGSPSPVDVEAVLSSMAASSSQKLNWRVSIVDLMKLLDLDSSLENRKELAAELGYKGDTRDSASMNVWLHKAVMKQLAANGGKVPAELKD